MKILNPEEHLEISAAETKELLDSKQKMLLIDCREEDEYSIANIPGARLMPMSDFEENLPKNLSKDLLIIIHCHHGLRSLRVANLLRAKGFRHTYSMEGGIDEWALNVDNSMRRY